MAVLLVHGPMMTVTSKTICVVIYYSIHTHLTFGAVMLWVAVHTVGVHEYDRDRLVTLLVDVLYIEGVSSSYHSTKFM